MGFRNQGSKACVFCSQGSSTTAEHWQDLWRAMRQAGSNFAIATSLTVKALRLSLRRWPCDFAPRAVMQLRMAGFSEPTTQTSVRATASIYFRFRGLLVSQFSTHGVSRTLFARSPEPTVAKPYEPCVLTSSSPKPSNPPSQA